MGQLEIVVKAGRYNLADGVKHLPRSRVIYCPNCDAIMRVIEMLEEEDAKAEQIDTYTRKQRPRKRREYQ